MTAPPFERYRRDHHRRTIVMRLALAAGALALALGAGGCFLPALSLLPLGVQAAETVGSSVVEVAASAAASHTKTPPEDEIDHEERCDDLELDMPGLIELHADKSGNLPQWRELALGGSTDEPVWEPMLEKDAPAGGWHPAQNLTTMNFAPPLESSLTYGAENYMAYAPAEPTTSVEQDRLVALTVDFGAATGTFHWNGRVYQYSVVRKLPCFPPPIAMK
jgi:hypothetical protein